MLTSPRLPLAVLLVLMIPLTAPAQGVVYRGSDGPGKGKHIVLVSGDEEYRSEEALPQLGKILAKHHGFECTVLFAIDPKDGTINPTISNIPGLEALKTADLVILFLRWRHMPDEQMKYLVEYIESGKPIIGMRTATHAFKDIKSPEYAKYNYDSRAKQYAQGFGRQVLGETWISHHGDHGRQSTRGLIAPDAKDHPVVRGIKDGDIWGPTDVYGVRLPLPGDTKPLVLGQVLKGMKASDEPVTGKKNEPMMPVAWVRTYHTASGNDARVFATTMGASQDLDSAGLRRLLVNASYWCLGMEQAIDPQSNVAIVGEYRPTRFGDGAFQKGVRPRDLEMK
jgi:Trehalose utilisation